MACAFAPRNAPALKVPCAMPRCGFRALARVRWLSSGEGMFWSCRAGRICGRARRCAGSFRKPCLSREAADRLRRGALSINRSRSLVSSIARRACLPLHDAPPRGRTRLLVCSAPFLPAWLSGFLDGFFLRHGTSPFCLKRVIRSSPSFYSEQRLFQLFWEAMFFD
jgi:hypothetical protein